MIEFATKIEPFILITLTFSYRLSISLIRKLPIKMPPSSVIDKWRQLDVLIQKRDVPLEIQAKLYNDIYLSIPESERIFEITIYKFWRGRANAEITNSMYKAIYDLTPPRVKKPMVKQKRVYHAQTRSKRLDRNDSILRKVGDHKYRYG